MDLLIGDVFRNAARAVPQRAAVRLGEQSLSFEALDRAANRAARRLRSLGVAHGDLVLVRSATTLDVKVKRPGVSVRYRESFVQKATPTEIADTLSANLFAYQRFSRDRVEAIGSARRQTQQAPRHRSQSQLRLARRYLLAAAALAVVATVAGLGT